MIRRNAGDRGQAIAVSPSARWARILFPVLLFALAAAWATASQARETAPETFADLAEKLLPAVVNISTTQVLRGRERGPEMPQFPPGSPFEEFFKEFFERQQRQFRRPRKATSLGSGFIIDPAGYIVTNNHVIADADEITVILQNNGNTNLKAKIVGRDAKTDLALLKVDVDKPLPYVTWGDSNAARVGDWVLAIGNPFGLGGTVTAGIISARQRDINAGPYDDFIQTDASINRGNSGGPMFNLKGEVIGINSAIYSPSGGSVGIGFAIPSALAQPVIRQLKEYGRTRRGWLGVRIQTVTEEIAESLGLEAPKGALVASVAEDGPAKAAGIEAGDVILEFDGKKVTEMRRLPRIVAETPIDKRVKVVVWRKGKKKVFEVKVGELEEAEAAGLVSTGEAEPERTIDDLGLALAEITPTLREEFEIGDEVEGVLITEVKGDSVAADKGLRPGDVIVEVGQEEVKSPSQVARMVEKAKKEGRKSVLLLVDRGGDLRFVALKLEKG